ncbi:MAG: hypothetical protein RLZZ388_184 [Bacillota bacterium]|jgi:hypothetical protein
MNKKLYLPIIFVVLSGCRPANSSSISSVLNSSTPIPNEDFNPYINGRTILRETLIETTHNIVELSVLDPLPLFEFNYPTLEDVVTPYAVIDAVEGDFQNQNITFLNQNPNVGSSLSSLALNQQIEGQEAILAIRNLQPSDERFNQTQIIRKHRDLSHVYFGSDYYWFNNFVEEEELLLSRHPNLVTYGQGTINLMFQTEISIDIDLDYQLYADATTIYEIRDETYPVGFFGAQDRKFETIRTQDNFKQALTMGPLTTFIQQWESLEHNQAMFGFPFHGDITLTNRSLTIQKIGENIYEFQLEVYLGGAFESAEENYQMRATLNGSNWENIEQHYQLWQPTSITP